MKWNKPEMLINSFVCEAITASGTTENIVIKDGIAPVSEAETTVDIKGATKSFSWTW